MDYNKEDICKSCEYLLLEEDDIVVSLSKLLYFLKMEKEEYKNLIVDELKEILKEKTIFSIYDFPEEKDLWEESEDEKMAERGMFKGDKVMLLDKKPSNDDIKQMLLGNLDYLYRNLNEIPKTVDGIEADNYTEASKKVKELHEKFSNLIIDQDE